MRDRVRRLMILGADPLPTLVDNQVWLMDEDGETHITDEEDNLIYIEEEE